MNASPPIRTFIPTEADRMEEAEERRDYHARARRIVERKLPHLPARNPLYDADGFRAAAIRHNERERLFWRTFARLRAKTEGGLPYVTLPHGHDGFGPMAQVARELKREASEVELLKLSKAHRQFNRQRVGEGR